MQRGARRPKLGHTGHSQGSEVSAQTDTSGALVLQMLLLPFLAVLRSSSSPAPLEMMKSRDIPG